MQLWGGDVSYIEINGGIPLEGEIKIQGSKNAVLPILAASILNKGCTEIYGCPHINDVENMIFLLKKIGCKIRWRQENLMIDASQIEFWHLEEQYAKAMRSSVFFIGAMLGRVGYVKISYPGGCSIGKRPIDIHLEALRKMNVEVIEKEDSIICQSNCIKGAKIILPFPSVGATENIIMTAVMAEGDTLLINPAREPEIEELCYFLIGMGACIHWNADGSIGIKGKMALHDVKYKIVSDRIVAGTYLAALAVTKGNGTLIADCGKSMQSTLEVFQKAGCQILVEEEKIFFKAPERLSAVSLIETRPYPGFPTDMQSQIVAVLSVAKGKTTMVEHIFESRYESIKELKKLGADILVNGKYAYINGVEKLKGNKVEAKELRGGAALVLAGLFAEGTTRVQNVCYIERGYEDICGCLSNLGASIRIYQ